MIASQSKNKTTKEMHASITLMLATAISRRRLRCRFVGLRVGTADDERSNIVGSLSSMSYFELVANGCRQLRRFRSDQIPDVSRTRR